MHRSLRVIAALSATSFTFACGGDSTPPELSAPAKLTLVSGDAQTVTNAPAPAPAPLVVRVTDPKDRPVGGVAVTWAASDPTAVLSNASTTTDGQGQTQITWTLGQSTGPQSVTATTARVAGARVVFQATNSVTSISGSVTVARGTPPLSFTTNRRAPGVSFTGNRSAVPVTAAGGAPTMSYVPKAVASMLAAHHAPARRLIVQFKSAAIGAPRAALTSRANLQLSDDVMHSTMSRYSSAGLVARAEMSPAIMAARVTVPDSLDVQSVIAALSRDAAVESVQLDEIVPMLGDNVAMEATPFRAPGDAARGVTSAAAGLPNDPFLLNQYWHYNLIDAFRVWPTNTGSNTVLVAVVDQGVRFDHPGMAGNFTTDGYNFVTGGNRLTTALPICAASGTGTSALPEAGLSTDATLPDDFLGISSTGCLVRNTAGDHGLHVSATIGAPGNDGIGGSGINWAVRIRPVRVLDITGSGSYFDIAQGVLYAAGLPATGAGGVIVSTSPGAQVINMSLGGGGDNSVLRNAIAAASDAGSLIVASAGNSSTSSPSYPAAYPQVLSVVALGPDLQLSYYSNVGTNVSLAAPGGDFRTGGAGSGVLSATWNYISNTPNYAYYSGTSMAAPHVTGVAALVLAANPGMTGAQLRQRLQNTAVDIGPPGRDDRYGYGIVNAYNAVNNVTSTQRTAFVRIVSAASGDTVRTVAAAADGSFSASRLAAGSYYVVAGEDEAGDKRIGLPGRRFGWFGGATPAPVTLAAGQAGSAAVVVGTPVAAKPNGTFASATRLFVNSYVIDQVTPTDPAAVYVVQIPKAGTYVLETSGVLGTCGLGLELDTMLELYDASQTLTSRNDNAVFPGSALCSQISAPLAAGTYYLRVTRSPQAGGISGGQFRISVRDSQ